MSNYLAKYLYLLCMLSLLSSTGKSLAQGNDLLGKQGARYTIPQGKFPKWDEMLFHWSKTQGLVDDFCEPGLFSTCFLRELQDLVKNIKSKTPWEQINIVNDFVNQIRYREDIEIYGVSDYWAIPHEFFDNELGDCEDYSLTKYFALKDIGFKTDDLQIAVVKDVNINIYHAVLTVKYNGQKYILDNRLAYVMSDKKFSHYQVIYTINEDFWWFFPLSF